MFRFFAYLFIVLPVQLFVVIPARLVGLLAGLFGRGIGALVQLLVLPLRFLGLLVWLITLPLRILTWPLRWLFG